MNSSYNPESNQTSAGLTSGDFTEAGEPWALFDTWMKEATKSEINDPNAMQIATVDSDGLPDVRTVLLKSVDPRGFVFYTNMESNKGRQLLANPKAAMVLYWKSLGRQIRARGPISLVSDEEADAYYQSRARDSRIGAWASSQSRPLESRFALEKSVAKYAAKYLIGEVPRPSYWTGVRIVPQVIEFWADKPFRLHDRIVFTKVENGWSKTRLYP